MYSTLIILLFPGPFQCLELFRFIFYCNLKLTIYEQPTQDIDKCTVNKNVNAGKKRFVVSNYGHPPPISGMGEGAGPSHFKISFNKYLY